MNAPGEGGGINSPTCYLLIFFIQHVRQNLNGSNLPIITQICLISLFLQKIYLLPILDNLYVWQKVVLYFSEGQKFQFLSYPLPPVYFVPKTVLQIIHYKIVVVNVLCFLADQTHLITIDLTCIERKD